MRTVRFLARGFHHRIVEPGEEINVPDDFVLGAHMVDIHTGERGGQPDPAIAPLPRYADVMRRVGQMFPKMLGPDDTLLLYDAERNTYAPASMPKPELVTLNLTDGGSRDSLPSEPPDGGT